MTPARLLFSAFLFTFLSTTALSSGQENQGSLFLDVMPTELIQQVFLQLGNDRDRFFCGLVCRDFQATHMLKDFPDDEVDAIVRDSISPDSKGQYSMEEARRIWQVENRDLRRVFREKHEKLYGSMANFVAVGDHVGVLNAGFLALRTWLVTREPNSVHLDFPNRSLKMLPWEPELWMSLTKIDLSENRICEIPDAMTQIPQLYSLNLSHNCIRQLPAGFNRLSKLAVLKLDHNELEAFPEELRYMTLLMFLTLEDNKIRTIPRMIGDLTNLELLSLTRNEVDFISSQISRLERLETLYLDRNKLMVLPDNFWTMTSLVNLWLNNNQIFVIPPEISQLTHLSQLTLQNNCLLDLPETMRRLPLDFVNFQRNTYLLDGGRYPQWIYQWAQEMLVENRYVGL